MFLLSRPQIKKDDLISEIIPYYTLYIYPLFSNTNRTSILDWSIMWRFG